ncbi:hypothetical protein C4J81_15135 [Deltaproteobacteria bacterium Smac51]|nr:hypothetical protein C4J81_15135 [Deltaproteobacteria bacterium Smac51]
MATGELYTSTRPININHKGPLGGLCFLARFSLIKPPALPVVGVLSFSFKQKKPPNAKMM